MAGINPIDPATGKPRRGRPRNADQQRADFPAGDGGIGNPGEHGQGDGGGLGIDAESAGIGIDADAPARATLEAGGERVTVEAQTDKPRKTRTPRTAPKKSGVIKPEHVENWLVQGFAFAAMMRNAEYWAIKKPEIEVRPWAPQAAELLNKIPAEQAEKITELNAAVAVTLGMFMLVNSRLQVDRMMRMQAAKAKRSEMRQAEGLPPDETRIESSQTQPLRSPNGRPGTGAGSVHPGESIFGTQQGIS